jgi:hypothetical protein
VTRRLPVELPSPLALDALESAERANVDPSAIVARARRRYPDDPFKALIEARWSVYNWLDGQPDDLVAVLALGILCYAADVMVAIDVEQRCNGS